MTAYYQRQDMLSRYRGLYGSLIAAPERARRARRGLPRQPRGRGALMAGIGWKLQRMIDHGSLAGTIGAYLTGVAVTSAPWLLTTAVLTSLRLVSRARRPATSHGVERFLTVVYAVTVVLSAPVHVVVSRYTADRLYDRHIDRIAAPLRRAAALTVLGFALIGRRAGAVRCACRSRWRWWARR